jgi:hypothetical protein
MTAARMTAAELGASLRTELPHMFDYDDLTIVHADGRSDCPCDRDLFHSKYLLFFTVL